jgi:chemotaxis protein methyltransferase CheR
MSAGTTTGMATTTGPPTSAGTAVPVSGEPGGLSTTDFGFLRQLLADRSAIVLDDGKEYLVQSRLGPVLRSGGMPSIAALVDAVRRDPRGPLAEQVIDAMTTNETSFFRDLHPFEALAEQIIPEILGRHGRTPRLTVWCGACSSGQEPYSLAITLLENFPELEPAQVRIIATDLSPTMVQRCREGRFSQLEVNRGMPARLLVRHFTQDGTDWVARAELRRMIHTSQLNLTESWDCVPRCDLVMLRNVLIYFSVETKQEILGRIRTRVLGPGGYLMLGASETTMNLDPVFERTSFGRSSCYRVPGPERA